MKQFFKISFASLLLTLGVFAGVAAHGGQEEISKFDSQISVSKGNIATITETILYDFDGLERHGIKRFVPLKTKAGDTGKFYFYNFKFLEAHYDSGPVEVKLSHEGNFELMRLGDPDKTISGQHTYVISYQMMPVIEQTSEGDYFNWNLTGNNWEVPIDLANITVSFEPGVNIVNSRCYSGPTGSTAQACDISPNQNSLSFQNQQVIEPGEGLTANVLLPANSFANYLAPADPPPPDLRPGLGFAVGILALLIGSLIRLLSYLRHRYRQSDQTVVAQYEITDNLSPAEIGLLNDNRSNMTEISATLIDLAVRGYIRIEQTQAKGLFKKAEYTLHKLKDYANVREFEKDLLDMLFGTKTSVALKAVSASKAATTIGKIQQQLKSSLEKKGYYAKPPRASGVRKLLRRGLLLIFLAILALNIFLLFSGTNFTLLLFSTVVAGLGMVFGWFIGNRTELTASGYQEWAEVEGLKLFLTVTEKERLKFHDAPDKNPKLFNKLLPAAIALGVEKQWAKQFEGMDISKETGWYSSHHAFTPYLLASSLSSDFSPSVSSNFTPTQSSSGFSGGGSSGGGGGGGGGGSW